MNKNNLPVYFAVALVFGILIGYFFNENSVTFTRYSVHEQKVKRLINFIQQHYIGDVNIDKLLDGAIAEIVTKLDPHSVYIPKENLQEITENMQGNFVGIGIQFRMIEDTITVIHSIKGGPGIKKGILPGDRILTANNDTLYGKKLRNNQILATLKGKPDTRVTLQIYRKSNDSLFNTTIYRGKVNIKSVDVTYMLNDSIGYIKLNRFAQNTYKEFKTSLDELLSKGMTDLVLDLRKNGGGFIHIANKIVDEFLENDKLIVSTKDNRGEIIKSFATEKGNFEKGNLYVLIDENSASASEIVAGALQDNDKGIIIGRRSFGKGLVQEEMSLGDGSAVRLTTAHYYTPTGRSIQKPYKENNPAKARDADKLKNSISDYNHEIENRYRNGELFSRDSIKTTDSLQYITPKGRIVYGGGGIIPDVFVSIDTAAYLPAIYFNPLNRFAFEYVDTRRKELSERTFDEFAENFDKDHTISNAFFRKIQDIKIPSETKDKLRKFLKMTIARELFNDEGWYRLNHLDDKMIQQVFELERKN